MAGKFYRRFPPQKLILKTYKTKAYHQSLNKMKGLIFQGQFERLWGGKNFIYLFKNKLIEML
jgi:hypothetical protein